MDITQLVNGLLSATGFAGQGLSFLVTAATVITALSPIGPLGDYLICFD